MCIRDSRTAVKAMIAQAGPPVLDGQGLMRSGVILRHLALPGAAADTRAVLRFMAKELPPGSFLTSLMSQYTPFYKAKEHKALGRRISTYEYRKAVDYAVELGLTEGFMQEKSSAKEEMCIRDRHSGSSFSRCSRRVAAKNSSKIM